MAYYTRKTDANQQDIMNALRECGYTVWDTHVVGRGFPDIIVGSRYGNVLMEIKTDDNDLNDNERKFFQDWLGPVFMVNSPERAIDIMQELFE